MNVRSLATVLVLATACAGAPSPTPTARAAVPPVESAVERGAFLVRTGACTDCHTPMRFDADIGMPVPDKTRFLSGHPEGAPEPSSTPGPQDQAVIGPTFTSFRLPFGTVYAANLTPDVETGLGGWTEDMFVRAIRTGQHRGEAERPILPPMPWTVVAQHTDEDLRAIFAYLRSLPPIRNQVPDPAVPREALDGVRRGYEKLLAAGGH